MSAVTAPHHKAVESKGGIKDKGGLFLPTDRFTSLPWSNIWSSSVGPLDDERETAVVGRTAAVVACGCIGAGEIAEE
jgi:hypothetical protein